MFLWINFYVNLNYGKNPHFHFFALQPELVPSHLVSTVHIGYEVKSYFSMQHIHLHMPHGLVITGKWCRRYLHSGYAVSVMGKNKKAAQNGAFVPFCL